ncbi:MAG: hypothetical protein AB1797_06440 [bacterium]
MAKAAVAEAQVEIPPYYDRFLDEREKRFVSEITRLEGVIKNGDDRLNDRINELKEDMIRRFEEVNCRFEKVDERFARIGESITDLRKEMNRHFRWMMGLFAPLILGVGGLLLKDLLNLTR